MIRAMKTSDVPRVAEIHIFGQRTAYRGLVSEEFLFGKMTVEKRMDYFKSNGAEGYVFDDGVVKGFITLGPCEDEDGAAFFELYRIFVDPFMLGDGIGVKLAAYFEDIATERGYNEICLWVLEGNVKARAFYEKLGYIEDGAKRISGYFKVYEVRYIKRM
ncbi:MAG: GNAT family N-acetyltransferase [Defluviitaleaceae bacterium]|nr:GNAT family N-acetyltransferase [Defluviitaleaceae bacterium]